MRVAVAALVALLLLAGCTQLASTSSSTSAPAPATPAPTANAAPAPTTAPKPVAAAAALPPLPTAVGHLFVLMLENENFDTTFPSTGTPPSPYLAVNLTRAGHFLTQYYGTGHASLDNYIAMVSGQAPNALTQADCAYYMDFAGSAGGPDGQAIGQGCVYPPAVQNLGTQLSAANRTWRQYAEDMANLPDQAPTACRHQKVDSQDTWQGSTDAKDQYATRHVPFVYFHSVIDDQGLCDAHVVDLGLLPADLAKAETTPNLVFITPDVCSDGHDATCVNPDQKGGYAGIDAFLRAWVPRIVNSSAFQKDGLLVVTFDEAEAGTPDACCNEKPGYNTPEPGISGPGGGRVGAVLLSRCFEPGTVDATPYNHYSFLRTAEDIFRLPHLGYAGQDGLAPFGLGRCEPAPRSAQ